MERTKNAVRNIIWGFLNKIIILLFPFVIRTIIIRQLGSEYLGLNSLFTSILQVLNLAELGFSSAVVFSMYKPIAENDKKTICALMNLYKKIYRIIGCGILIVGISLTPFIKKLINGSYPNDINIYILYIIYLLNTSFTYFLFAYKSTLLNAHQRNDITSNINTITSIIQYVIQIIILYVLKNYYIYVIITIITTIINNLACAYIANKKYPEYLPKGNVSKTISKEIKIKVSGLMIQRICATTRNSLDSIFISAFIGLNAVAIYNNYYIILNALIGMMGIITSAITAGIGNSIVTETIDKNYNDMNKFNFIYMWISGWWTICLACLYQPFMNIWMGKEYMFDIPMVILFCIYFYSLEIGVLRGAYSDACGLWWENRYRAIIESIANVMLNFILIKLLGIAGVILGTNISLLIINFGYGSQILFKHYFTNKKSIEYFKYHGLYALVTCIIGVITYFICSIIKHSGLRELILKGILCTIIPNILYYVIYRKTKMFEKAKEFILNILRIRKKERKG